MRKHSLRSAFAIRRGRRFTYDLHSDVESPRQRLSPEEAIAIARKHYPDARFCHFHPPANEQGVYEVAVHQDNEVQRSYGRTQLFINQYTGRILAKRLPENDTLADTVAVWQFPLHNGEAFGLLGRWVVFFSGMTPAILYTSGMLVWIRKRKANRGRHERLPSQNRLGTDLVSSSAKRHETMITG